MHENITYTLNGKSEVSNLYTLLVWALAPYNSLYTLLVWALAPYNSFLMVNICNLISTKDKVINCDFPAVEKHEHRNACNKCVLCEAIGDV